jgi:benzoyl-CoA reductase/2-hydroxyglutaryl-CoA dehydratase subunit BcrC/BadD/HgdB
MNNPAKVFHELLQNPLNRLAEQAVGSGRIPVGYSCSFVPESLLMADRLFPLRLHAPGIAGTELADNYLSGFICSYARSLLEFALDDRFDPVQGFVFVPSCAHMQRLIDNLQYLRRPAFIHVLDVPRKKSEVTTAWLADELKMLADRLAAEFGVDMGEASLKKAMEQWNEFAGVIQAVSELRKKDEPLLTGAEFHALLMASLASPKDLILPLIQDFRKEIENRPGIGNHRARLVLMGSHLQDPAFIRTIESQGGLVVADRFCTGTIPGFMPMETDGDPFQVLAGHSFRKTLCPRMMEDFDRRLAAVVDTVREYRADGVVVEIMKFCDLWGVDAVPLVSTLRKEGIPVLRLEREYRTGGEGQLRTRVQAFIESMGK